MKITHALEAKLLFPDGVQRLVSIMLTEKRIFLVRIETSRAKGKPEVKRFKMDAESLAMVSEAFNELTTHPGKWETK